MQAAYWVEEIGDMAAQPSLTDAHMALMSKIAKDGDRAAFKALFLHFAPRVKGLMIKSGASHNQAEDIVQTVMMTVWRKGHQFAPERGSVSAWIFTIARNTRIDRLRRGNAQPYIDIDDLELEADTVSGEDGVLARQRAEKVSVAIRDLPEEQRQIIELAFVEDISQSEISKKLALPLGTVKSRMRLAYAKLKDNLGDLK